MKSIYTHKHILKIALATLVVSFALSCDDLVDESPISEINPNGFFRTNKDALGSVIGTYDAMQGAVRLQHFYWGEFRADNYDLNEAANPNNAELANNNVTQGNSQALDWGNWYDMINRANFAISQIPTIPNFDANLLAEAQALRAFAYFQAIRVWGDVPLFMEPTASAEDIEALAKPRTDANTIINEVIIPDMLAAEENFTINRLTDPYRFSLTSLWSLQAEVYGYLGNDEAAREALLKVVNSNRFSLTNTPEDWQNLFLNDNGLEGDQAGPLKFQTGPELIMSVNYNITEPAGGGNVNRSGIFSLFFAGVPSYLMSTNLENKWREKFPVDSLEWVTKYPDTEPALAETIIITDENGTERDSLVPIYGDYRFYFSREGGADLSVREIGEARMAKYNKSNYNVQFDDTDIVLYRYSGTLLYLAELENRLGNDARALELVNEIRTARQLPLVDAIEFGVSVEERELFILDERQLELFGEAHRWWDLIRTGRAIEIMNPILSSSEEGVPLTEERLFLPVFEEHLLENENLEQTTGY
ncbi:RagB/SusD family nutrient uptake outer membrane protein [Zobellia sp. B3R18]|uniref:RagB/SusD family nutrient uptake outer membrane protein n=1 Tax=Zobellia sp. B3R18 TaxID=2841568 RepID=UPI001C06D143|nr:RagB/SusD family nutrient uptake outer membrane protein [Zobellia sp. B3R18]MBU2973463.1 RagB/SusD family nutrient uptake outer membrane protein [Zobellia sp. B3R18]